MVELQEKFKLNKKTKNKWISKDIMQLCNEKQKPGQRLSAIQKTQRRKLISEKLGTR